MQLDWTTLLLEIINFLILIWILKHFLYRPVLEVIARRKASIEQSLDEARMATEQADTLKAAYEKRLEEWEQEREGGRTKLREELAQERERRMAQLEKELDDMRERKHSLEQHRLDEIRRATEVQALELAGGFAARLLERLASAQLDESLIDILIEDLARLSPQQSEALRSAANEAGAAVQLNFARELPVSAQQRLSAAISKTVGAALPETIKITPELLAGVRISIGPWILKANLQDELAFFRTGSEHA